MHVPPVEPGEVYVELSPGSPVFPAVIDKYRSRDWAVPYFRRSVAEAVLAWLASGSPQGHAGHRSGYIEGDAVITIGADGRKVHCPLNRDGRIALKDGTWSWFISAPPTDPHVDAALLADPQRLTPHAGEELVTITVEGDDPCFPATLDADSWNGWACPRFRRPVAEAVVAWINRLHSAYLEGSNRAYWDGDNVVLVDVLQIGDDGYEPGVIEPDGDGRYCIGGEQWTWQVAEADAEVVQGVPADEGNK